MNPSTANRFLADFGRVIALGAALAVMFTLNLVFSSTTLIGHALLFLGSLYSLLFTRIALADGDIRGGYVQTGEGALGLLVIVIMVSFFSVPRAVVAAVCVVFVVLMEFYMHMVGHAPGRGRVAGGLFINLCAAAAGWYAVSRTGTGRAAVEDVLSGFSRSGGYAAWESIPLLAVCIILYVFLLKAQPELKLFSQGRSYFEITGLRYGRARIAFVAARGVAVSGLVLFAGCLAGVGFLAGSMREKNPLADELKNLCAVNIFLQAMVTVGTIAGNAAAAAAAVALSYLLLFLYRRTHSNG
ncbi:MAG TPA: hypothetical protein PKY31_04910 [Spirochaetota bacterium]|nr:hypothetical protein [Spirochaetota bacterium]